jgi:hypothetical protein
VRFTQTATEFKERDLPNTLSSGLADRLPVSWTQLYSGDNIGLGKAFYVLDDGLAVPVDTAGFGTQPGGTVNPRLRAEFGNTQILSGTLVGHIRNFVVSCPGRFVRAFFRSYSAVVAPVLRLNFVSDQDGLSPKARILVRYGSLGLGTDPYAMGTQSVAGTLSFDSRNIMFELPLTLTGLSAKSPFWFSVERDWEHADDLTRATIHLVNATVRST